MGTPWDPEEDAPEYDEVPRHNVQTTRHGPARGRMLPQRSQRGAPDEDPRMRAHQMVDEEAARGVPGAGGDGSYQRAYDIAMLLSMMQNGKMPSYMHEPPMYGGPDGDERMPWGTALEPKMPPYMGVDEGGAMAMGYPEDAKEVKTTREKPRRK
jgi:hypothetical protein